MEMSDKIRGQGSSGYLRCKVNNLNRYQEGFDKAEKQAGAEVCQAQVQLAYHDG